MNRSGEFNSTSGNRKLFHTSSATMMLSAPRPGLRFGRMMLQNVRQRPAPSTSAASSSSFGSDSTNWRIRNTANGFTSIAGHDQREVGVDPAELAHQQVERDQRDLLRDHLRREEHDEDAPGCRGTGCARTRTRPSTR